MAVEEKETPIYKYTEDAGKVVPISPTFDPKEAEKRARELAENIYLGPAVKTGGRSGV